MAVPIESAARKSDYLSPIAAMLDVKKQDYVVNTFIIIEKTDNYQHVISLMMLKRLTTDQLLIS